MPEPAAHLQQCAALPCLFGENEELRVMLYTARSKKHWIVPKGRREEGLPDYFTAAHYAYEKAGLYGCVAEQPIGSYSYDKRLKSGRIVECGVELFLFAVEGQCEVWPQMDECMCLWLVPEVAAILVDDPGLRSLLLRYAAWSAEWLR